MQMIEIPQYTTTTNYNYTALLDIFDIYGLHQLISEPTRITKTSKLLIDLCITNSQNVVNSGVFQLGISDHFLVYMTRKVNYARTGGSSIIETRQFKRFKAENFLQDLEQKDWNCIVSHSDPNKMWDAWRNLMMSAIDKHAPLKKKRVGKKKSPWITCDLLHKMRIRDSLKKSTINK